MDTFAHYTDNPTEQLVSALQRKKQVCQNLTEQASLSQMLEEIVEGDSFVPQERVQQRTVEVPMLEAFGRDSRGGHWLFMKQVPTADRRANCGMAHPTNYGKSLRGGWPYRRECNGKDL